MATYELPIEAATLRLSPSDESVKRRSEQERAAAYGRRQAVLALNAALEFMKEERRLATKAKLFTESEPVARGFILCERVDYGAVNKNARTDLSGLLLARKGDIYAYRSRLPVKFDLLSEYQTDAWGEQRQGIRTYIDGDRGDIPCDEISVVDLSGSVRNVDLEIGAIAAPLTLDDLLAGLAVKYSLEVPAFAPTPSR